MIGFVMQVIATIGIYFLPESPKFLIEQNRISEARECLEYIASINKADFNSANHDLLDGSIL